MTDIEYALTNISEMVESLLQQLVDGENVKELIMGAKTIGAPEVPRLKCMFSPKLKNAKNKLIGSASNRETWNIPLEISSVVEELDDPMKGFIGAVRNVSKARNIILETKNLNLPDFVVIIDSETIDLIPFPFNKKRTYYGAGTVLTIQIVVDNQ